MAKYKLTIKATKDLRNIWNYTVDTWSENQADQYYHMLLDSCKEIADGKVKGKQYEDIYSGLLGIKAGKYLIFYRRLQFHLKPYPFYLYKTPDTQLIFGGRNTMNLDLLVHWKI